MSEAFKVFTLVVIVILSNSVRRALTCDSISSSVNLKVYGVSDKAEKACRMDVPFFFELELELQAFYFDFSLSFVLQDALVGLAVLG